MKFRKRIFINIRIRDRAQNKIMLTLSRNPTQFCFQDSSPPYQEKNLTHFRFEKPSKKKKK